MNGKADIPPARDLHGQAALAVRPCAHKPAAEK